MTYDPSLTSIVLVAVLGVAILFLNLSSDWELSRELARATDGWTTPLLLRRYRNDARTRRRVWAERGILRRHGYHAELHRRGSGAPLPAVAPEAGDAEPALLEGIDADEEVLVAYYLG